MKQYKTHNNQTPHNNESLAWLLNDQQRKKVSNVLFENCFLSITYLLTHLQLSYFQQA
jgi:hypothetical protein